MLSTRLEQLLTEFESVRSIQTGIRFSHLSGLLRDYGAVRRSVWEQKRLTAPDFSLFEVLRIDTDELSHSRTLAWTLNPFASHAQGPSFFTCACASLKLDIPDPGWEYTVRTEHREAESRIDIVVYGRRFLIYLENKIDAQEGYRQTEREARDMFRLAESLRIPKTNCRGLFISPRRVPMTETAFLSITWAEIAQAFEPLIYDVVPADVRSFLFQWLRTLKSLDMQRNEHI